MDRDRSTPNDFLKGLKQPNFLWGVVLGLIGAGFWALTSFGQWSRQDERFQTELRYMSERVARLEAARDETAKADQIEALRDAEFRTKTEQALNSLRDMLTRLDRGSRMGSVDPPFVRPQRWPFIPQFDIIPSEPIREPPRQPITDLHSAGLLAK